MHQFSSFVRLLFIFALSVALLHPCAAIPDTNNEGAGRVNVTSEDASNTEAGLNETNATAIEDFAYEMLYKGIGCSRAGDYACTRESFDAADNAMPDNTVILYNYGVALANMKRYNEAIGKIDAAIALDPEYAYLWYGRGAILKRAGNYAEAGYSFERAESLDPHIGVSFFDHYPANFLLDQITKNITLVVLLAGFGLLGVYIWFNEKNPRI